MVGDVAQLVERLNGIQEVEGSTPFVSTNLKLDDSQHDNRFCLGATAETPAALTVGLLVAFIISVSEFL